MGKRKIIICQMAKARGLMVLISLAGGALSACQSSVLGIVPYWHFGYFWRYGRHGGSVMSGFNTF
ncbi:hypothetical protein [Segatella baroniae]|uniref:hypothetical protein n=1 Tax=Segatella baroniae TaxID=305719 RepID=UPI0012B5792F|nr:hypothetical protein [Segatella baroniae]